jgi:hypothetical protein
MVLVNTIFLRLNTKGIEGAGTDGDVYLGIGGREFSVDSKYESYDDFEPGNVRYYIFGEEPHPLVDYLPEDNDFTLTTSVLYPEYNDPKQPYPLDTDDMDKFPVYIRFEPEDDDDFWCLEGVIVRVNPLTKTTQVKRYDALQDEKFLWLGRTRENFCFSPMFLALLATPNSSIG